MATDALNLDECFAQIGRARELHDELVDAINEWTGSGGAVLDVICHGDGTTGLP
jgi:hypothetical protein